MSDQPCDDCNGSGTQDDVEPETGNVTSKPCDSCKGSGRQ